MNAVGGQSFTPQIRFFRGKLNLPTRTWTDVWQEGHDTAFMVAGAYKADLLADLRQAVDLAIIGASSLDDFRKDFDRIVAKHGWQYNGSREWRTRVIFETNLRTTYMAGRFAQLTNPDMLAVRPFWEYKHDDGVRNPRPQHLAWNGLILRHDDPFWLTHFPPNGWGCQCEVRARNERDLKARGKTGPDTAPPERLVERRVGVTGPNPRTVLVPDGIDPGWAYTPGRSVADTIRDSIEARVPSLPPPLQPPVQQALTNIPRAPTPPPPPAAPRTLSTVGDFEPEEIAKVLEAIPGAEREVAKLGEFLTAHPAEALILKESEIGGGRAARKIVQQVQDFFLLPTSEEAQLKFVVKRGRMKRANGFTSSRYSHVVVKAVDGQRADDINPADLPRAAEAAITPAAGPAFSMSQSFRDTVGTHTPVTTLIHEIGHQVHFWAGAPLAPRTPAPTRYGRTNKYEWHAEVFALWLFNRAALAIAYPEMAAYMDRLVDAAIASTRKGS